jgi:hypothetical protein
VGSWAIQWTCSRLDSGCRRSCGRDQHGGLCVIQPIESWNAAAGYWPTYGDLSGYWRIPWYVSATIQTQPVAIPEAH